MLTSKIKAITPLILFLNTACTTIPDKDKETNERKKVEEDKEENRPDELDPLKRFKQNQSILANQQKHKPTTS
jgi:hypothetical protein